MIISPASANGFPPPPARFGHVAIFDPKSNRMHIFFGDDGSVLNDDWFLTDANALSGGWTQVTPGGTLPLARVFSSVVYDSSNHTMVVFGGETAEVLMTDSVAVLPHAAP